MHWQIKLLQMTYIAYYLACVREAELGQLGEPYTGTGHSQEGYLCFNTCLLSPGIKLEYTHINTTNK